MASVVPFLIENNWYAVALEHVNNVDSMGVISPVPNAPRPIIGLMYKKNTIFPVWNLVSTDKKIMSTYPYCIELSVNNKSVIIPVKQVKNVINVDKGWVLSNMYGVKVYRPLDKKEPTQHGAVVEITQSTEKEPMFFEDSSAEQFKIEEI